MVAPSRGPSAKARWRQLGAVAIIMCSVLLGIGLARQTLRTLPTGQVPAPQQATVSADAAAQQLQTRTMKARELCVQPDMDSEVHIVYASCGGGRCARPAAILVGSTQCTSQLSACCSGAARITQLRASCGAGTACKDISDPGIWCAWKPALAVTPYEEALRPTARRV